MTLLSNLALEHILIVEDDDDAYVALEALIRKGGVREARIIRCTKLDQLAELKQVHLDLILTDLGLPDSSVEETFPRIYAMFPLTPIIVLTGTAGLEFAAETISRGAQDYLVKGEFDQRVLVKSIQYAIQRKRMSNDYRRLFEYNPVAMYIYDRQTLEMLMVNNAAVRQYGYSYDEFLKLSVTEIRPPEEIEAFQEANRRVHDMYTDFGRWKHRRSDGSVFYAHLYAHRTVFAGRDAVMVLAVNIDERVRAEQALEKKNREIERILESITDGFYAVNENWEITYFNKAAEKILRYQREDILGKSLWDCFPEAKDFAFYPEFHKAMEQGVSVHLEEYYPPLDIWVAVSAYPAGKGLVVYFVDITEQKRILEKLYHEQENLKAIINNTTDIIWSIDRDLKIISANDAFWKYVERITGIPASLVHKEDFDTTRFTQWSELFERSFEGETFQTIWHEQLDGDDFYQEVSFNPIKDIDGNIVGASCFSRDITQQRKYLHMIEKQNENLSEIARIQSHEVRSPVATILGLAELIDAENPGDEQNAEVLEKIKEAARELDNVIKKITGYTCVYTDLEVL